MSPTKRTDPKTYKRYRDWMEKDKRSGCQGVAFLITLAVLGISASVRASHGRPRRPLPLVMKLASTMVLDAYALCEVL